MIYLKLLIRRLTEDDKLIKTIDSMDSDEEILTYLLDKDYKFYEIIDSFESYYGIEYIDLKNTNISLEFIDIFTREDLSYLRSRDIIPCRLDLPSKNIIFALNDITSRDKFESVKSIVGKMGYNPKFKFAFKFEIEDKYRKILNEDLRFEGDKIEKVSEEKEETDKSIAKKNFSAKSWVENILNKGISYRASDIHVETRIDNIQIRYRIDGVLSRKENYSLSESEVASIIVRLKLISSMDISEKRKSQDGRISQYIFNDTEYNFRVSTINTNLGEKIVLRIFNKSAEILTFESIGLLNEDIEKIKKALSNKSGIIYIAGATGTGKTTTLYTMIDNLNTDEVNIYTIEDPIEKEIENINQIQVDTLAGITYPNTLRSILRQDPDIVVVGEIRDRETADLSISASLTGHLVLATIHANGALDSISRLYEMDIEPFLLASSSIMFMSQKLIRKLCPHCKRKKNQLNQSERIWMERRLNDGEMDIDKILDQNNIYEAVGCENCTDGYRDRTAIAEVFLVTREMRELIAQNKSIGEIEQLAYRQNFKSLEFAGINKILSGETSIEEIVKHIG